MAGIATAGTIGATSIGSIGRGASRGSPGSMKGAGVSLSGEALRGGNPTAFSSRSLGAFNVSVNSSPKSEGNFAKSQSLRSAQKSPMVDSAKITMTDKVRSRAANPFSRVTDVPRVSSLFENKAEVRNAHAPKLRDISRAPRPIEFKSITPKPGMIDMGRPRQATPREVPRATRISPRNEYFKATPVRVDLLKSAQIEFKSIVPSAAPKRSTEARPDPFKSTVVLWERPKPTPVTTPKAPEASMKGVSKSKEVSPRVRYKTTEAVRTHTTPATRVDTAPQPAAQPTLKDYVSTRIKVDPKSAVFHAFELDMREAQIAAQAWIAVGRTPTAAYESVTRAMIKMHQGKPGIEVVPQPKIEPEAKLEAKPKTQGQALPSVKTQPEEDVSAPSENDDKKNPGRDKQRGLRFYFKTHTEVLQKRFTGAIDTVRYLLSTRSDVSGQDIAYELSKQQGHDYESEVVSGVKTDETYTEFLERIKNIGTITEVGQVETDIHIAANAQKPVKLSFSPDGEQAAREEAAVVYGGRLEGETAYFKDNHDAYGTLVTGKEDNMWFIPTSKNPLAAI